MIGSNQAKIVLSAEDKTAAAFASVSRGFDTVGKGAANLASFLPGIAAGFSVGAMANYARELARTGQELDRLAKLSGTSIERFQAEAYAAERAGISQEKYADILKDVQDKVGDFLQTGGGPLKDFFEQIGPRVGVTAEQFRKLGGSEALQLYVNSLQKANLSQNELTFYMEAIASDSALLLPLLKNNGLEMKNLGDQAKRMGLILDQDAIAQTKRFDNSLRELEARASGFGRQVALPIIEELNNIIKKFEDADRAGKSWLGTIFLSPAEMEAKNRRAGAFGLTDQAPGDPRAGLRRMEDRSLDWGVTQPAAPLAPPKAGGSGRTGSGRSGSAPRDPYAEGNRYLESLRKQLQATEELTVYEKLLADIRDGSIGKLNPQLEALLKATAKQIDADKELNAITQQFAELNAKAKADQAALAAEGARIWEETRTPLERLNIEQAKLDKLLKAGVITFDTWARKSFELEESLRNGPARAISELDQFTQRAAQNMQDYLGSSFQQIMEGNFDNIGDAFVSMLNNMVAQAAAAQLSKYLFGDLLTGKSGGGNGAIGDFIGSAASSLFGGFRADGGDVQRGKGYIVGERGPEWFEPATSGTVVPNHALGGQTIQVSNVFHLSGSADRRTQQQLAAAAGRGVQLAMSRNG